MHFTVQERIILLTILPREGDLDTIKIVNDLRNGLSFSEEEHKELNFKQESQGNYSWDQDAPVIKELEIGEKANEIISTALEYINTKGKVTVQHLELYEKFDIEV